GETGRGSADREVRGQLRQQRLRRVEHREAGIAADEHREVGPTEGGRAGDQAFGRNVDGQGPTVEGIRGRGERIRSSGLYVPNVARYQAKLHPDSCVSPGRPGKAEFGPDRSGAGPASGNARLHRVT